MRTSRTRTATLAAVTAALALGLTACGSSDDGSKAKGDKTTGTTQNQTVPPEDGDGGKGSTTGGADGGADGAGDKSAKGGAERASGGGGTKEAARAKTAPDTADNGTTADVQQCVGDEITVNADHRFAGEQGDHLLLTVANTGDEPCWVTSYPSVKLGDDLDDPAPLPHSEKDRPGGDERITLHPGTPVYSAVNLFDHGTDNRTATSFAMALRDTNGQTQPYYSIDVKGDQPEFTWTEADVLNWSTEKPYDF
ncbi:DUF4232 domain-containing protein [Streptomyces sp. AC536]|uniref:DUF4232 domain-containing protein n=1 Tax=Streptomyces buecherae TaxID=2763006 RepID=UPI00164D1C78|nr:DUF4232 domain-containing protein [Streptomyces buecherae]MBC3982036.1 DUF4232 domain-containing protein [Streptomyces buecherae]QNJ41376.1 DUF4232 domain-containing protein [Streptomyces buecherae]